MVLQRLARDLNVVERNGVIRELLVGLMSLSGDQDNIARLRQLDRAGDGFRAVGDLLIVLRAEPFFSVGDDRVGIFFPWIIGSDDAEISVLIGHPAHERTLLFVAIAAATENENEATR